MSFRFNLMRQVFVKFKSLFLMRFQSIFNMTMESQWTKRKLAEKEENHEGRQVAEVDGS